MDRTERFYKIQQLLTARRVVPRELFLEKLGVSLATFKRDLEYLRDRMCVPIVWDREQRGYRYGTAETGMAQYELPGLWFNSSEIHALLTMQHLLHNLQPGLLEPHIEPLQDRVYNLLDSTDHSVDEIRKRVRLFQVAARPVKTGNFELISSAVLSRKRLHIKHYNRARDVTTEREVSPQRLVYYRDNWYLDAWCHLRNALRSFSLAGIHEARGLDQRARSVAARSLDAELGAGYGIFAGSRTLTARLRFTPERARWVADERWHPKQKGRYDADGHYILEVPYSDDRELLMDILKYGADVEVLGPARLRRRVIAALDSARGNYPE